MTRHKLAWTSLAFGVFFLAIAGNWVAGRQDVLTRHELGIAAPITLIVLGVIGVIATIWRKQ